MNELTRRVIEAKRANPDMGRRRLADVIGVPHSSIRRIYARRPWETDTKTDAAPDLPTPPQASPPAESDLRGFVVGAETRCSARKPATTARARIYTLKRGRAYPTSAVAEDWHVSEETVRRHAQDADCFRYVETAPEQWAPCVMHPDTAKQYPVQ